MSISDLFGEETTKLNEHSVAWLSRDWDSVKKLADSFKTDPANEFFDLLNRINTNKSRTLTELYESYNKYSIDASLSRHIDCLTHAYNMNLLGDGVSEQMHFDYYLHSVRPAKRYSGAGDIADPIETICHKVFLKCLGMMFKVSAEKASEYFDTMTIKQENEKLAILRKLSKTMATESLIKEVCPFAKKGDITKALRVIGEWSK